MLITLLRTDRAEAVPLPLPMGSRWLESLPPSARLLFLNKFLHLSPLQQLFPLLKCERKSPHKYPSNKRGLKVSYRNLLYLNILVNMNQNYILDYVCLLWRGGKRE